MRHRDAGRKFGRNSTHRNAMFRNMATSLVEHGRITTTEPKAKELRRIAEKTISISLRLGALLTKPKLLILDEPTSVLTPQAVERLFVTLRKLADEGCSILYISHKLDEIRALCHHCTVLRGGKVTGEVDPRTETNAGLSRLMIGAEPPALVHRASNAGAPVLRVDGLSLGRASPFGMDLQDVALEVRAGEVLGIAGVSGNGQQELMAALSGEDTRAAPGSITLAGDDIAQASPRARRKRGLHFVPEERLGRGAVPGLSLAQNTLLTRTETVSRAGWIATGRVQRLAEDLIARFQVRAGGAGAAARLEPLGLKDNRRAVGTVIFCCPDK